MPLKNENIDKVKPLAYLIAYETNVFLFIRNLHALFVLLQGKAEGGRKKSN